MASSRLLMILLSICIASKFDEVSPHKDHQGRRIHRCESNRWGELCPNDCVLHAANEAASDEIHQDIARMQHDVQRRTTECGNAATRIRTNQDRSTTERTLLDGNLSRTQNSTLQTTKRVRSLNKTTNKDCSLIEVLTNRLHQVQRELQRIQVMTNQQNTSSERNQVDHKCAHPLLTGRDCADIYRKGGRKSGVYFIKPDHAPEAFRALCDMDDSGGGWTVIQRRFDGSLDFDRSWREYKRGFGQWTCDYVGELWLGNEQIYLLTEMTRQQLKVDMKSWSNESRFALYRYFRIGDEGDRYRLQFIDNYTSEQLDDIGDAFRGRSPAQQYSKTYTDHKGMRFTTRDEDNDKYAGNCASGRSGGWWYNRCSAVNLNAKWYNGGKYKPEQTSTGIYDDGILWATWKGRWESLKETMMKVRPLTFN